MTVGEQVKQALGGLRLPLEQGTYTGTSSTYITYNYDLIPFQFADNQVVWYRALVQVHLVAPLQTPIMSLAHRALSLLVVGGFTAPEVIDTHEPERRHIVLECELAVPASEILEDTEGCGCRK